MYTNPVVLEYEEGLENDEDNEDDDDDDVQHAVTRQRDVNVPEVLDHDETVLHQRHHPETCTPIGTSFISERFILCRFSSLYWGGEEEDGENQKQCEPKMSSMRMTSS